MNTRLLAIVIAVTSAAGAWEIARRFGIDLTLSPDAPPWAVGLGAVVAAGGALALAWLLDLRTLGARLISRRQPVPSVFDELADIAELARREGILHVAADHRTARYPVLGAGIHLMIQDADEMLVRAALEAEEDVECRRMCGIRAGGASLCRVGLGVLTVAAAGACVFMASRAGAPWALSATAAAGVLGAVALYFCWICLGGRLAAAMERRNAEDLLVADASLQTALAVHRGDDRAETLRRLGSLLPEGPESSVNPAAAREAA